MNRRRLLQVLLATPAAVVAGKRLGLAATLTRQAAPTPPPQRLASPFEELTTTAARCAEESAQAFQGLEDILATTSIHVRKLERALRTMNLRGIDSLEYMLHCSPEALYELRKAYEPELCFALQPENAPGLGYAFHLHTPFAAPMKVRLDRYLPTGGWVLAPVDWDRDWYNAPLDHAMPQQVVSFDGQFMRARWQPEVIDRTLHQDGSLELTLRRGPCEQRAFWKGGYGGEETGSGSPHHMRVR